jgi:predicted DNA-binding transcriptional regulator AlpA
LQRKLRQSVGRTQRAGRTSRPTENFFSNACQRWQARLLFSSGGKLRGPIRPIEVDRDSTPEPPTSPVCMWNYSREEAITMQQIPKPSASAVSIKKAVAPSSNPSTRSSGSGGLSRRAEPLTATIDSQPTEKTRKTKSPRGRPNIDELQTLTAEQIAHILQCTTKTLKRYCRKGLFPQPIPGVGRLKRWNKSVVVEFLSRNPSPNPES